MQVRKCPGCGVENKPQCVSCVNCSADVSAVPLTLSRYAKKPAAAAPSEATATQQTPAPPVSPVQAAPQAPQQTVLHGGPPPPTGPMPYKYAPALQEGRSYGWVIILALAAFLGVACFIAWKSSGPPPPPKVSADKVVKSFLAAKRTNSVEKCKPYLSEQTVYKLEHLFDSKQARSAGIDKKEVADMFLFRLPPSKEQYEGCTVSVSKSVEVNKEEGTAIVMVTITPKGRMSIIGPSDFEYVLVNEASEWKVDTALTDKRALGLGINRIKF